MKVSVSSRPEPGEPPFGSSGLEGPPAWRRAAAVARTPAALIAIAYVLAHLPFLAPSLEDYDSINFALGLRDFDPARHQPHPPGSPVYIAAGRLMFWAVDAATDLGAAAAAATTLALMSAAAGALALAVLPGIFRAVSPAAPPGVVPWAAALTAACPLFWLAGLRPMSDLPGLAAALASQGLMLRGRTDPRLLAAGALLAGLAAGIRVQTLWLTFPLLVFVLTGRRPFRAVWSSAAALAAGGLVWAIPLVIDSGGVAGYLRALGTQAGEDFAWVRMLWLEPTPRRAAFALYETFVLPWGSTPLAAAVALPALAGALAVLVRDRRALLLLLVLFGPYAAFHLLFQETLTVRYALPVVPLVAWLAARGLSSHRVVMPVAGVALLAGALLVALPAARAYGEAPHPAFRAIADASRRSAVDRPAAVFAHFSLWRALQAEPGALPLVEPRRLYEWLGPAAYWQGGGTGTVWFLADPRRTDLALIDPHARRDLVRYRWAAADRPELSGARPLGADWYRMAPPGWFATEGWSLTPETGGLATATATRPDHQPITAWVRRGAGPLHLVVGGRHIGDAGDPPAAFELALDGAVRDRWTVTYEERNFLRFVDLPEGNGGGSGYAPLTIRSRAADGGARRAPAGVYQFDIQPVGRLIYAFGEGWHEEEYDVLTGQRWRWTSDRSLIRVWGPITALEIVLRGESPLRYFDAPPDVRLSAGGRVVATLSPSADFEWRIRVPAADVAQAQGVLVLETDRVYLPGEAEGTADARRLGLRIYEWHVSPVVD